MQLASYFQEGMVIQRGKPISIFGFCSNNERISIRFEKNGYLLYEEETLFSKKFMFTAPMVNDTSDYITISLSGQKSRVTFTAFIGDVFLLTGQSNMAYPFYVMDNYPKYKKKCLKNLPIRYLNLGDGEIDVATFARPLLPEEDINSDNLWSGNESKKNRDSFSGIGIYFAHEYYEKHKIPVGLVNASVGGCSIDSFLPQEEIFKSDYLKTYLIDKRKIDDQKVVDFSYTQSSGIFNEKIAPLKHINWKSVFWYQGEHHVGDSKEADYYKEALSTLIKSFRDYFLDENLGFGCIQIANNLYPQDNGYGIPLLNEAIQEVARITDNVFTVPIYDIPIKWENPRIGKAAMFIHPTNKLEIALRLFKVSENQALVPYVKDEKIVNSNIILTIENVRQGLRTSNKLDIQGFTIADEKGVFYKGTATLFDENKVIVCNPRVKKPSAVMYGFYLYNLDANLINSEGVPLLIYRSNKKNSDESKYLSYHPLFDMTKKSVQEIGFFPLIANPKVKKRFVKGKINQTGKLTLNYTKNGIICNFVPKNKYLNYFGISPNLGLNGTKLRIFHDQICEIVFNTSDENLVFSGILAKFVDNSSVQFPVDSTFKNKGIYTSKVSFRKAFNVDLTVRTIEQIIFSKIKELQFVFETNNKVQVKILSIDIFKGDSDDKSS